MPKTLLIARTADRGREWTNWLESSGFETQYSPSIEHAEPGLRRGDCHLTVIDDPYRDGGLLRVLRVSHRKKCTQVIVVTDDPTATAFLETVSWPDVATVAPPKNERAFIRSLRDVLESEGAQSGGNGKRARRVRNAKQFGSMLGNSTSMRSLYEVIAKVADTTMSVLINGESGTGKELVAQAIHHRSPRKDKPLVTINCGAIPENLIESELFGHEKGAFTGAERTRRGVFERAHGATLFLDEVTEMPAELQVRLLRVLETGVITRVGGEKEITCDVRVIAACNRDPEKAIAEGLFREDLYYRLAVFPIAMPPLRERDDDGVLLANHFIEQLNRAQEKDKHLSEKAARRLKRYSWPGNVRQLQNVIQRAFVLEDDLIELGDLEALIDQEEDAGGATARINIAAPRGNGSNVGGAPRETQPAASAAVDDATPRQRDRQGDAEVAEVVEVVEVVEIPTDTSIAEANRKLIESTLERYEGNKTKAAEALGISLKTLYNRLNEYEAEDREAASP